MGHGLDKNSVRRLAVMFSADLAAACGRAVALNAQQRTLTADLDRVRREREAALDKADQNALATAEDAIVRHGQTKVRHATLAIRNLITAAPLKQAYRGDLQCLLNAQSNELMARSSEPRQQMVSP